MFHFKLNEQAELRIVEERYAEEMYATVDRNRARLRQWMPWVDACQGPEEIKAFIQRSLQRLATNHGFDAAIFVDEKYVGNIGFHDFDWLNRRTSIGYWLDQAHQGRGLVTAAARALTHHALHVLKLNRVEIQAGVDNTKSRAIPERLGFTCEGTLRQAAWVYDRCLDMTVYSMLASEWGQKQASTVSRT